MDTNHKIGVAVCTPMPVIDGPDGRRLEPITVEWHRCRKNLATPTNWNFIEYQIDGMEVGEARCEAARLVLAHQPRPEFLFFLDYDVLVPWDALQKLVYRARCFPDYDVYAGVYVSKSSVPEPLIYKGDGQGGCWDWTLGDLLLEGVTGIHMGLTLLRTSYLAELAEKCDGAPLFRTETGKITMKNGALNECHGSEDLYHAALACEKLGRYRVLVDTSVLAGHIQNATGKVFGLPAGSLPIERARGWYQVPGDKKPAAEKPPLKKALDLGAGPTRRAWDGYQTFTSDIDARHQPDYVMDTRWLNLPDESFDLVASNHHLEHIPRWEQERVWAEMFRILKPGGHMEHTVPNLLWAAWKLVDQEPDQHVWNVLYGDQEGADGRSGHLREHNLHYFGYTPQIARALAEQAGLADVQVRSFEDDENLGFDLIVTGTKPLLPQPEQGADSMAMEVLPK